MTTDEDARVEGLLEEASGLVEGYCKRLFTDPVPRTVAVRTSRMVARVFGVDDEDVEPALESEQASAGSFQLTRKFGSDALSGGPWLSGSDKVALRPYRRQGVVSVATW
ncbi:hypothetical protein I1A62_30030 [Rhodococcus sp. USK10]|uniref:hypothetical protein n=1 Tax=Rhodococcus sp. USK10 TaxID=2789739 RepID=UPI001C5D7168|nr:hypothetical protein [Rhodococcus sp. USK10]QYB01472.1 hypothetical protein I1A62_30030 [Rhodococcus sp. USK10]